MKAKNIQWALVLIMFFSLIGCSRLYVDSQPYGAKVIIDGVDTGRVTPAEFSKGLYEGIHQIEVEKEGYISPAPQTTEVCVSPERIAWSILLPVPMLFINLGRGFKVGYPKEIDFFLVPQGPYPYPQDRSWRR